VVVLFVYFLVGGDWKYQYIKGMKMGTYYSALLKVTVLLP